MANITKRKLKNGVSFVIEFTGLERERRRIFLGSDYTEPVARGVAERIGELLRVKRGALPRASLEAWIEELDPTLSSKLAEAGLIKTRDRLTCELLWDRYERAQEKIVKPKTIATYRFAQQLFFRYFSRGENPEKITTNRGSEFRSRLVAEGFTEATIASIIQRLRALYNWAIKNELLKSNPFLQVHRGSFKNKNREFFVSREAYQKLLEACPNQDWRTLITLCRIGAVRCPSEVLPLRWQDVNWEQNRLLITSPKTERLGNRQRLIPLFPELREELGRQWDQAEPGDEYVIRDRRSTYYRPQFERIVFAAGLDRWPRLFHNLRGSRDCELSATYPIHVAASWLGHSPATALRHYLHPTDADFEAASSEIADQSAIGASGGNRVGSVPKPCETSRKFDRVATR